MASSPSLISFGLGTVHGICFQLVYPLIVNITSEDIQCDAYMTFAVLQDFESEVAPFSFDLLDMSCKDTQEIFPRSPDWFV